MTNVVDRRLKVWAGMSRHDWIALFLGRIIVPTTQDRPPFWRVNWVQRQVWFSSFHMTGKNLETYVNEIRRRPIRFLEGYPSTLYVLAKYLLETGHSLPMEAVITSSETLHGVQRSCIEAAFQCKLFDFYALAERAAFAGECEQHCGKHIAEDYSFVEIVDENGRRVPDGHLGYVTGTNLHNYAMPLIRYRTDDIASIMAKPCECGRILRRLSAVATKADDIIVTPDGRWISPSVLTHPFKTARGIEKSQIVQDAKESLVIRVVAAEGFEPEGLIAALRERLGPEMHIRVEQVSDIPREPSGKFRWVKSTVQHSRQVHWD